MKYKFQRDIVVEGVRYRGGQIADGDRISHGCLISLLRNKSIVPHDEPEPVEPEQTIPKRGRPRKTELTGDENDG